jgi:hypothetical protein
VTVRRIVMADDPKPIVDDPQTDRSFRPSGYMTLANHVGDLVPEVGRGVGSSSPPGVSFCAISNPPPPPALARERVMAALLAG